MRYALLACMSLAPLQDDVPPGLSKGKRFPDFLLPNVEGGFGRLSDHLGKKLLVINFASW
jgi:hypothetical protein